MEAAGVIRNTRRAAPHRRHRHTARRARVFEANPYKTHDTELHSNNVSRMILYYIFAYLVAFLYGGLAVVAVMEENVSIV